MLLSRAQYDLLIISRSLLALFMLILIWFLKDSIMSKTTLRSISSVQQRIGVLLVLELWFLGNNQHCHDYMLLI